MSNIHTPIPSVNSPSVNSPSVNSYASRGRRLAAETRLPLATNLVTEWRRTAVNRRAVATVNAWGLPGEPVRDLFELVHRAGFEKPADDHEADQYLVELVRIARTEQLAARAVLQRILPGLINVATRRAPITDGGLGGAFEKLLPAAWEVIKRFPFDTRGRRVAANLLLDIEYAAFVRDERRVFNSREIRNDHTELEELQSDIASLGNRANNPTHDDAAIDLIFHDLRRHGLTDDDLVMIRMVQFELPAFELCDALKLKPRSIRSRREVAIRKAREALREQL